MKRLSKLCFSFVVLFLAGCFDSGVSFTIRYDDVDGLKKDASLMHEAQIVGKVNEVNYTDQGHFNVNVTVDEKHHELANDSTLFVITNAPESQVRVIKLITSDEPGAAIQDDQVVEGSTKLTGLSREIHNQIGESLEAFTSSVNQSISDWVDNTAEPTVEQLNKELDQLIEDVQALGEAGKERFESDVVDTIKQHIERLKQQVEELKQEDNNEDTDELEKKVDELEQELQEA